MVRGRATGALFFAGFGTAWLLVGLLASGSLTAATGALVLGGLALLVAGGVRLLRAGRGLPHQGDLARRRQIGRTLGWTNLVQWLAILAVFLVCQRLVRDDLIVVAVTAVVGLHLFSLGQVLRSGVHVASGAALLAWAALTLVLVLAARWQTTGAVGTGARLVAAAVVTLGRGTPSGTSRSSGNGNGG